MLEKWSKMSAREAMISLAGRPPSYGEQSRWLSDVAKRAGITFRTARSLWLGEISKEDHLAMKRLKEQAQIEEARREVRQLAVQYAQLAGGMRAEGQNLFSAEIDRLERIARILGGLDRA
jgi:hypothetical protein